MSLVTRVAVATTATEIVVHGSIRRGILVYNGGPNTIWVDDNSGVTSATGFPVPAGSVITIDRSKSLSVLWAICSVLQVSPADTAILAES